MKINLGSGRKKKKGYVNVDNWKDSRADVISDCLLYLKQQKNSTVDEIFSRHFFEHVSGEVFGNYLSEFSKCLKSNGVLNFIVPHWSNPAYFSDPTHKSFFGLYTMHYYCCEYPKYPRKIPLYAVSDNLVLDSVFIRFIDKSFFGKIFSKLMNVLVNTSPFTQHLYENNFCRLIPCYEIEFRVHKK